MTPLAHDNSNDISADLRQDLSWVLPYVERAKSNGIAAYLAGREVSVEEAILRAAELVKSSIAPAIVGLNGLTIEAAREALALAEKWRAKLLPLPACDAVTARMSVMQTATLGHSYSADLRVAFREDGERHANPVEEVIASRVPNTLFVKGDDLDALLRLRMAARGSGASVIKSLTALPVKKVVVVLPAGVDGRVDSQWHHLAAELQKELRVSVIKVPDLTAPRAAGNLRAVIEVITWQTGLSCATGGVDFADGAPRPCSDAATLLSRGAVDVAIDTGLHATESGLISRVKHRIRIGDSLDAKADVCFVSPGLRVGLRARVMRFDGVIFWLCEDPSPGAGAVEDPVVQLLSRLGG